MPTTPIPAIGTISDPAKVRIALVQGQQIISAPLSAVANVILDSALGSRLLFIGDAQVTGFDSLELEGGGYLLLRN